MGTDSTCKTTGRFLAAIALVAIAGVTAGCGRKTVPVVTGDRRVDALLSRMTLDEKISLTHGAAEDPATFQGQAGFLPGVPRLGVPPLRFADGPPGVLTRIPATAPVCTMGLAATFSREDARENGVLIGREARVRGIDVVLQPFINMDRDLTFTRTYNTFGEDPLLTGEIGAAQIRGTSSQGVMSMAKHYVAYDTETFLNGSGKVTVDQQTLHEIYVAPFAAAIKAGAASLMCSYSIVNGKYSCGNPDLLITILRREMGFKGFVASDWGATHATTFINDGLDMEMGGPVPYSVRPGEQQTYFLSYFAGNNLAQLKPAHPPGTRVLVAGMPEEPAIWRTIQPSSPPSPVDLLGAIKAGNVTEARVTQAAGRVLYEMDQFAYLTHPPSHAITATHMPAAVTDANAAIILKTGEDAAVLLKNEDHALPLTKNELASLAMIGPGAGQVVVTGRPGEQARGLPVREAGPLEALKKDTDGDPDVHILYAVADDMTGTTIPAQFLSHDGKPGLVRTGGRGHATGIDPEIDFTHSNGRPLAANTPYEWDGILNIPSSGAYRLHMQLMGSFGTLKVDHKQVAYTGIQFLHGNVTQAVGNDLLPTTDGLNSSRVQLNLSKGPHVISLSVTPDTSNHPEQVRLNWLTPQQRKSDYQAAIAAARKAKTTIIFAWDREWPSTFALPGDQDKLIEDVAAVNPNTIVVLNIAQPVAMPWLNRVKGVLLMWWPGDEGGWATANILLGKASPAGRLPFTWPRRLEDTPIHDPAHPERLEAADGKSTYSEGIFIGYRWFDKQKIQPLFPFGYGLSYTHFVYSGFNARRSQDGGLTVSLVVKNTGEQASGEVPQVYLGAPEVPPRGIPFAVRALAAFDRIYLQPGQSQAVTLHVPARSLEYWSTVSNRWITAAGKRMVYAGPSSRDLPLHVSVNIPR